MTKEERNKRLNEIMAIYTKEDISLQTLSDRFEISYQCISKFLKNNGKKFFRAGIRSFKKQIFKRSFKRIWNRRIGTFNSKFGINENGI